MDNAIPFDELEKRRRRASAARKQSQSQPSHPEGESEALAVINEIFNPSLKLPESKGPYRLPDEMRADDTFAQRDLDISKLAELKEVFLLFDTDCDGLISKDDLRFTMVALGGEVSDVQLEEMLKEARDPLDYEAFVELMFHRTIELDPEDVLLEAWSKWDDYGTGKIEEKRCLDGIEIFPYLREAVIENSTSPEYVICNRSSSSSASIATHTTTTSSSSAANALNGSGSSSALKSIAASGDGDGDGFIYSAAKVFGIRVRFKPPAMSDAQLARDWPLNITGEYRLLKKDVFNNDGRLIPGSFCDYYFFADATATPQTHPPTVWQYFHSPRFPAKYPAHIKCAYKFIGRPETRVEIVFEELHIPRLEQSCSTDKLTIFDSESANMNAVIDVVCDAPPTRRIVSSGPDLLVEFNASSNVTAKGFRGKFKFLYNELVETTPATVTKAPTTPATQLSEAAMAIEKLDAKPHTKAAKPNPIEWSKSYKGSENCKHIYDSRTLKFGRFTSAGGGDLPTNVNTLPAVKFAHFAERCRFEFYGEADERVQIKFLDFNIPTDSKNSTECRQTEALQLLTQVRGKYEVAESYCGAFLPKPLMSNGPKLILQFSGKFATIGSKISYYGFKAEYRFIKNYGITTGEQQDGDNCTFIYNSTARKSGWFGSPNFPGFYPHNIVCNYLFYGESDEKIYIRFTYFDVEGIGTCEYITASDHVEFSNFMSTDRKYPKYCGKLEKFEVRSDGRFFRITFYSNDRFDKTGFRALYDFESKHTRVENTSMQSYVSGGAITTSILYVNFFIVYLIAAFY